jgi:hypothetical protein
MTATAPSDAPGRSTQIGASSATVRRDRSLPARQGRLVRLHGGAATAEPGGSASLAQVVRELEAAVGLLCAANLSLAAACLLTEVDRHRGGGGGRSG